MTVAIIVAYGIRVIHDLQQFPAKKSNKQKQTLEIVEIRAKSVDER